MEYPLGTADEAQDTKYNLQAFLIQLQNLETLALCFGKWSTPPNIRAVRLPRLRSFETTLHHPIVFSWLIAPLLEYLDLDDLDQLAVENHETYSREILSLVTRSSCYILRLTLGCGELNMMPETLKALVNVEELVIRTFKTRGWRDVIPHRIIKCISESKDLYGY